MNEFLTQELILTTNNLNDVISWLKLGAYVTIYVNRYARSFHTCNKNLSEEEAEEYVKTHRFIYINVSKLPGLLDDGEWNYYIKQAGFDECDCAIKHKAAKTATIPNKDVLSLGS